VGKKVKTAGGKENRNNVYGAPDEIALSEVSYLGIRVAGGLENDTSTEEAVVFARREGVQRVALLVPHQGG